MVPDLKEYVRNAQTYYRAGDCNLATLEIFNARQLLTYLTTNDLKEELSTIRMIEQDEENRCSSRNWIVKCLPNHIFENFYLNYVNSYYVKQDTPSFPETTPNQIPNNENTYHLFIPPFRSKLFFCL